MRVHHLGTSRLTSASNRMNMKPSMVRSMRRARRCLGWALSLALTVVSPLTCVVGAQATQAPHACCAAMDHDCGGLAVKQDCCAATDTHSPAGLTSGSSTVQVAAPALVAVDLVDTEPSVARLAPPAAFDSGTPHPSSNPTYLLVSVFRL